MAVCEKCGREIPEGSVCECENEICDALIPADDNDIAENVTGSTISLAKESDKESVSADSVSPEVTADAEEAQADIENEISEEAAETAEEPVSEVKTEAETEEVKAEEAPVSEAVTEEVKAEETPAPEVKEEPAKSAEPAVKEEKKEPVKAETAAQTAVTPAAESGAPVQKQGFIKKNLKVIIPVAAALAAVIGVTGYVSANAYKKPVNQFVKAYNSGKADHVITAMLPKDSVKEIKSALKEEDTSWKELVKEMNDKFEEAKEDKYGKNAKMEVTFVNKYKAKKDEITKNSSFYSMLRTDEEIDKAYRVKLRAKIEGKDDSESERHELYVVHFEKSGWKLSPYMNDIDDSLSISNMFY
ncbi:hypothetical protein [Ruminococcus sp. HUN007]|uniref:hypothetical protein n=1 Tax=Ruminococcus sp. HUN007 TaxID=1514668 RepID=UPI000679633B|nr:hypothetical protein [Ruminococcus sp. HUN007]